MNAKFLEIEKSNVKINLKIALFSCTLDQHRCDKCYSSKLFLLRKHQHDQVFCFIPLAFCLLTAMCSSISVLSPNPENPFYLREKTE